MKTFVFLHFFFKFNTPRKMFRLRSVNMDKSLQRTFTKNGTRHSMLLMGDSSFLAYRIVWNWIGKRY